MSLPTIADVLVHLEPALANAESLNGADFERHGLPMFGGCACCGASIAAFNAHPGRSGMLIGSCCATDKIVYATVEAFLAAECAQ